MRRDLRSSLCLVLAMGVTVLGDTVRFKNGDVLTGDIVSVQAGKLQLKTAAMGAVTVDLNAVASIESQTDMSIQVKDQAAKVGRLTTVAGAMTLVGKDGTQTQITPDQLSQVNTLESLASAAAALRQRFSGDLLAGVTDTSGNTDTSSLFLRGEAKLSEVMSGGNKDPLAIRADYQYAEDQGEMSARRGQGELRYDNQFWKKTSVFFLERVSFDEFRDLNLRAEEQMGLAQKLIDRPRYGISADAGVTRVDSFYETAPDEGDFGLVFGGHAFWKVIGSLELTEDVAYEPLFEDFNNYLLRSETGIATRLSEHWKVKLIYQLFYDNESPEGVKDTDRVLALTFGYTF